MKILNLSDYTWENGGPAQTIFNHAKYQLAQGNEVHVLSPCDDSTTFYTVPEGMVIISCRKHFLSKFIHHFSFDTLKYLKKHGSEYDIIHIHGLWNFSALAPFLTKIKTPKIITVHGMLSNYSLNRSKLLKRLFSIFQKRILKKADGIHVLHKDEKQELNNYLGYEHPRAYILPNGIDIADLTSREKPFDFRQKYGIGEDKKIILFLGRIDAKKGIDLLMPAFLEVCHKVENAVLVLVGPDYGMKSYILDFVKKNHISTKVILTGMLKGNEKKDALAAADIFTLPSYSEGFSVAVLEALSFKLPVVVSDYIGFSNLVSDYNAGVVVDLTTQSISREIIKLLLLNQEEHEKMKEAAFNLVNDNFTMSEIASKMLIQMRATQNELH